MNLHPFEESIDEYFENVKHYLDPPAIQLKIDSFYEAVTSFKKNYSELNERIQEMEKRIERIDSDINILADMGKALDSKTAKERLKGICEEFIIENKLQEIKATLSELYEKRTAFLKALTPIIGTFDVSVTCPVCFENQVSMFNTHCGHTLCQKCSFQIFNKCAICRGPVNYKSLMFSY